MGQGKDQGFVLKYNTIQLWVLRQGALKRQNYKIFFNE